VVIRADVVTHDQYELFSPMACTHSGRPEFFYISLLLPGGQQFEATGSYIRKSKVPIVPEEKPTTPSDTSVPYPSQGKAQIQKPSFPKLVYVPPLRGAPGGRVGGGTRGLSMDLPLLYALVPDHVGLTTQEQPTLYWYLPEATTGPVDFFIIEKDESEPLFEIRFLPPFQPGYHPIRLSDLGVRLLSDRVYQWSVTLGRMGSENFMSGGMIQRVKASDSLSTRLAGSEKSQVPLVYAQAGIWFDSLSSISEMIEVTPSEVSFRETRAVLLEQVGLEEVAKYDRRN
jgi:hypothetical protein